jgi:single-stranded DNA-binding protein
MKQSISISIDVSKIDKSALYISPKNGKKYLSIMLKIREEKDQYGYDGFIAQEISKERKAAGEKGPILGNAKIMDWDQPAPQAKPQAPVTNSFDDEEDDIPF